MPVVRLAGCRSDSLLGYLKALGVLRLLSTQADTGVRGVWDGAVFVLDTQLSEESIEAFFLLSYAPTPILNPWNSGAGFDGKLDAASNTLRRINETRVARWEPYRRALTFIKQTYVDTGVRRRYLDADDKHEFVRDLRARCPEEMLAWLDASVLLTPDQLAFPYLLGSGGNDGRLDFSVNFAARALDVCGEEAISQANSLLRDALNDTTQGRLLRDVAIGQFSPRHAGGANATSGFSADSLVNPWDYVLMLEGALLFTGSIGRRTDRTPGRPVFPFALRGVPGGYGSASDEEQSRGEVWLPVWDGHASLPSVTDLLRKGRIDLPSEGERSVVRRAVLASEAATAVVTLGMPLGLRRLERVTFVQRNGLAFSAASVEAIDVDEGYDRGIAIISRDLASWVERLRRKQPGISMRKGLRTFDDLLFALSRVPVGKELRARARQELLVAIADLDRAVAFNRSENVAAPQLDAEIVDSLDDGTVEHRAALAVASLGATRWQTDTRNELRLATDDATRTLHDLIEGRTRESSKDPDAGWLRGSCATSLDDVALFLALDREERLRFNRLVRAYALIRLGKVKLPHRRAEGEAPIPAAYAVLKLVFDDPKARDERILRLLFTGEAVTGLALAVRRARTIRGLPSGPRDVSRVQLEDARWTAATLALPIERSVQNYRQLLNVALMAPIGPGEVETVRAYLASTE